MITLLSGIDGVLSAVSHKPVDSNNWDRGRQWVAQLTGLPADRIAMLRQVHSCKVHFVPWSGFPGPVDGDAMITDKEGIALCVRIADCAPVSLAAEDGEFIAIAHFGWRGAREGVLPATISKIVSRGGIEPGCLRAAVGPAIGPCCYRVGPEFSSYFPAEFLHERKGELFLDLPAAAAIQMKDAGLQSAQIDLASSSCTVCGRGAAEGISFYSHRASEGGLGRNIAFIVKGYSS